MNCLFCTQKRKDIVKGKEISNKKIKIDIKCESCEEKSHGIQNKRIPIATYSVLKDGFVKGN